MSSHLMSLSILISVSVIVFLSLILVIYIIRRNIHIWIFSYFRGVLTNRFIKKEMEYPIDIMFLFVDHFELAGKAERLHGWLSRYKRIASMHKDYDGEVPKHTWFYALDLMNEEELEQLRTLVENGFGEIELHWHHGYDTEKSFVEKLRRGLAIFQKHGYMLPYKPGDNGTFAFIHGNWALANSRGDKFCGVNNEIEILKQEGCYGDFTYPSLYHKSQPSQANSIYYASYDRKPKSYDKGREAEVYKEESQKELMIFQGPLTINWMDWRFKWHPVIEDGEINRSFSHDDPKRIKSWIRQGIHVKGRPEWKFVKIFCHGGQDYEAVLSKATGNMFRYLEQNYNDGNRYRLHYVTAREAYNIVKAAEQGKRGNPNLYRDYVIPHPLKRKRKE